MTTYREAIYMCLDLIKGVSDDFTYTEDHIAYLLDKYRALLLKQRYGNDPKKHVPYSNYQTVNITFSGLQSIDRQKKVLESNQVIPYMLQLGIPRIVNRTDNYYTETFEYISRERFPFVGTNKYLKNITYFAIDNTNHLLLHNKAEYWNLIGPSMVYTGPTSLDLVGIFENPRDIIGEDYLDAEFPIEEGLITTLIDLVVKELLGASYRPADMTNNNVDDNSDMASYIASNMKPQFQKQLGV